MGDHDTVSVSHVGEVDEGMITKEVLCSRVSVSARADQSYGDL